MSQTNHGRTFWDFIQSPKALLRFTTLMIVSFGAPFLYCQIFGVDLKFSLNENDKSIAITKREKVSEENNSSNVAIIDSLIAKKYLPLINNIYKEASYKSSVENQKLRNRFIIESAKLVKLLNLKKEISQVDRLSVDSINQKIYQIEND